MNITEVRIKLMDDPHDRLQAFCSVTMEGSFVIRDLKIIQGGKGSFVAMPSRKLTDRCPRCGAKNHLRAQFCNQCGVKLDEDRALKDPEGRAKLYADIAHPINSGCREQIQTRVLEAYAEELIRSQEPGYVCTYDDYGEDRFATLDEFEEDYLPAPFAYPVANGNGRGNGHHHQGPHLLQNGNGRNAAVANGHSSASRLTSHLNDEHPACHDDAFGEGLV